MAILRESGRADQQEPRGPRMARRNGNRHALSLDGAAESSHRRKKTKNRAGAPTSRHPLRDRHDRRPSAIRPEPRLRNRKVVLVRGCALAPLTLASPWPGNREGTTRTAISFAEPASLLETGAIEHRRRNHLRPFQPGALSATRPAHPRRLRVDYARDSATVRGCRGWNR